MQQHNKEKKVKSLILCESCKILEGGKEAVDELVNSASNINAKNAQGDTLLHVAAFRMYDALLDRSKTEYSNATEMVIYLADHCDINVKNNDGLYPGDILWGLIDNPSRLNSRAETALQALLSRNIVDGHLQAKLGNIPVSIFLYELISKMPLQTCCHEAEHH